MENLTQVTKKLLSLLKVSHSKKYLDDTILSHSDYPSLLAISDTLEKYHVQTLAIQINNNKLDQIPTPFITQINNGKPIFKVVKSIYKNKIIFFDHNKSAEIAREVFLKQWTGVCLLAEKNKDSKEPNIEKKIFKRNFQNTLLIVASLSFLLWGSIGFYNRLHNQELLLSLYTGIFVILKIIGLIIGILLLWFDIDQYHPTLQSFCGGDVESKTNCNAVLTSKYAKLLGGNLSLSILGFSYFFGTLFFLLFSSFSKEALIFVSFLSFLTVPVVLASIYNQIIVLKQWCKFCIIIQGVLIAEIVVVILINFYKDPIENYTNSLLLIALLLLPIVIWLVQKPLLEKEKEINVHKRGLKRIKNNPIVLEALLLKSRKISTPTNNLGISINNSKAKYNIIKVCNPYCGPCAKAHPILEELVSQGTINLQILFVATASKNDRKSKPVAHFLAIHAQGDKNKIQHALDDWYLSEQKNYETFAKKHTLDVELRGQYDKINAMKEWCDKEHITHTPTIFINGYELPKEYKIEDLKDVLV